MKRLDTGDEILARRVVSMLKTETPLSIRERLGVRYLQEFLGRDSNYLLVALLGEEPAGFALAYRLMRVDREGDMILFYEIVVNEEHRSKGVGKALVGRLKEICREQGVMKMWVLTNRSNAAAMALYRSTGGVECGDGDEVSFTYYPPYK